MINCCIRNCGKKGEKRYNLFSDKKGFTLLLCKAHAKRADKELKKRGLRVLNNGTYQRVKK